MNKNKKKVNKIMVCSNNSNNLYNNNKIVRNKYMSYQYRMKKVKIKFKTILYVKI